LSPHIAAGEFHQHEVGSRHDRYAQGDKIGGIANDKGAQIEPLADTMDETERP
jgi:hypothetical protein